MIVYKCGGDITGNVSSIGNFGRILGQEGGVVVVSAIRGVTDYLIERSSRKDMPYLLRQHLDLAKELGFDERLTKRYLVEEVDKTDLGEHHDRISLGERLVARIWQAYFEKSFGRISYTTGFDLGIERGEENFIDERCKRGVENCVRESFKGDLLIVTGFDAIGKNKKRTTLGRSGSDQTATFLAYCVSGEVYLMKNTEGVMSADPKIVGNARLVECLSYDMAMEAGNIQPEAITWAKKGELPIGILNVSNSRIRTRVTKEYYARKVELVTGQKDCVYLLVGNMRDEPGAEAKVMDLFAEYKINKLMSFDTRYSVSYVLGKSPGIRRVIAKLNNPCTKELCSLVTIIGNINYHTKNEFEAIVRDVCWPHIPFTGVSWIPHGLGSFVASIVIPQRKYEKVIRELHTKFIEG